MMSVNNLNAGYIKKPADKHIKILFITRKYPPSIGGMQKFSHGLFTNLAKVADVELIKWGRSQIWLPIIIPYFLLKGIWKISRDSFDVIYFADGLLAPLGKFFRIFYSIPTVLTIHGLDITYQNRFYQIVIPRFSNKMDKIVCISVKTKEECVKRGIKEEKIVIIPNGIDPSEFKLDKDKSQVRKILSNKLDLKFQEEKILLSVGRLVRRKGFHWFIKDVLTGLLKRFDFQYLIAGEGPLEGEIQEIINEYNMYNIVYLLGVVDDETLIMLYNVADICIMPNIMVKGDMEGFGMVALEASSSGLPVIASNIEGIKDSIKDGMNGFLVEHRNVQDYVKSIARLLDDEEFRKEFGNRARSFTSENYCWEKVTNKYLSVFDNMMI